MSSYGVTVTSHVVTALGIALNLALHPPVFEGFLQIRISPSSVGEKHQPHYRDPTYRVVWRRLARGTVGVTQAASDRDTCVDCGDGVSLCGSPSREEKAEFILHWAGGSPVAK